EFRNRLDAIIQFKPLGPDTIGQVVDKFVFELEGQLEEKGVSLEISDEARTWLAMHGYDSGMGARPMARLIQENIKKPLAEELLFGKLESGGVIRITVTDDALHFELEGNNEMATQ
ncbi:MAG: ATP-dependent Clp protease ATP-binding subunit ClpA, partial [Proteobacteria bacterium]|nr:ATP-dependent Clp protease ATP-binding subunit ClpA [Pseudomonadota bacterium]